MWQNGLLLIGCFFAGFLGSSLYQFVNPTQVVNQEVDVNAVCSNFCNSICPVNPLKELESARDQSNLTCIAPVFKSQIYYHIKSALNMKPLSGFNQKYQHQDYLRIQNNMQPDNWKVLVENTTLPVAGAEQAGTISYACYYNFVTNYYRGLATWTKMTNISSNTIHDLYTNPKYEVDWSFMTIQNDLLQEGDSTQFNKYPGTQALPQLRYVLYDLPGPLPKTDRLASFFTDYYKYDLNGEEKLISITIFQALDKNFDFLKPTSDIQRSYNSLVVRVVFETENPSESINYNLVAEETSFPISEWILKFGGGSNLIKLTKDIVNMSLDLINHKHGKTPEEIKLNNQDFQQKQFDFIRQHSDYHLIQNIEELYDSNDFQEYMEMILNGKMQCFNKVDKSHNLGYTDIMDQVKFIQSRMGAEDQDAMFSPDDFTTVSNSVEEVDSVKESVEENDDENYNDSEDYDDDGDDDEIYDNYGNYNYDNYDESENEDENDTNEKRDVAENADTDEYTDYYSEYQGTK